MCTDSSDILFLKKFNIIGPKYSLAFTSNIPYPAVMPTALSIAVNKLFLFVHIP